MAERIHRDIPIGVLDVQTPEHRTSPGTLRLMKNLIWRGGQESPYVSPAEPAVEVFQRDDVEDALSGIDGVLAMHVQVRQRIGPLSDLTLPSGNPEQTRERIIACTAGKIYAIDPGDAYDVIELYEWPDELKVDKKVQFAQIGDVTFMAVSLGAGIGTPAPTLVLYDDTVTTLRLPALPDMTISEVAGAGKLEAGTFGLRFAWLLKDGTVAGATRPYTIAVSADAAIQCTIAAYRQALPSYWSEIISGVQVAVCQLVGVTPQAYNRPYFRVATIQGLDVGDSAEWTDSNEGILSYPVFDDTSQLIHDPRAGAVASYNKRLILGDVAVSFKEPDPIAQAGSGSGGTTTNVVPTVSNLLSDMEDPGAGDGVYTDTEGNVAITWPGRTLRIAVEVEDTDGQLATVEYETIDSANQPGLPEGFMEWEGWNGSAWETIDQGEASVDASAYTRARWSIVWPVPDSAAIINRIFLIRAQDDDFGFGEAGFTVWMFPDNPENL